MVRKPLQHDLLLAGLAQAVRDRRRKKGTRATFSNGGRRLRVRPQIPEAGKRRAWLWDSMLELTESRGQYHYSIELKIHSRELDPTNPRLIDRVLTLLHHLESLSGHLKDDQLINTEEDSVNSKEEIDRLLLQQPHTERSWGAGEEAVAFVVRRAVELGHTEFAARRCAYFSGNCLRAGGPRRSACS